MSVTEKLYKGGAMSSEYAYSGHEPNELINVHRRLLGLLEDIKLNISVSSYPLTILERWSLIV